MWSKLRYSFFMKVGFLLVAALVEIAHLLFMTPFLESTHLVAFYKQVHVFVLLLICEAFDEYFSFDDLTGRTN